MKLLLSLLLTVIYPDIFFLRGDGVCDALWVQGKSPVGNRQQSSQKVQGFSTLKSLTFD